MQVGYISSSETKKCVVCGKKTAHSKEYEKSNISIRIPVCDHPVRKCVDLIDIEQTANTTIKLIKKDILLQKKLEEKELQNN